MPFKSFVSTVALSLSLLAVAPSSAYTLLDTYDASNWMSKFTVQNISDPTGGFVTYVTQAYAESSGLYEVQGSQIYIGVDHTNTISSSGPGRNSVRLLGDPVYNHALVIADFAHIPGGDCASWPAFWMVGPNWPSEGEIDIIEGVNLNTYDTTTLHTSSGCVPTVGSGGQTGTSGGESDCGAGGGYTGCSVTSNDATSYGTAFNANGGGVYAMLWASSSIEVWYFPNTNVPTDITNGNPNPSGWGTPMANWAGCDFDEFFMNLQIVFDITFCGSWAGAVWSSSSCSSVNSCCNCYVAEEPQSFGDTYWLVDSIKVYSVD